MTISSLPHRSVEEGLTYRFHAAWGEVLRVLEVFFEMCGKQCHPIMRKVSRAVRGIHGGRWGGSAAAWPVLPSPAAAWGCPAACRPACVWVGCAQLWHSAWGHTGQLASLGRNSK